jgi:RNA polymerase sigma-70 factor, ECF subfamily
MIFRARDGITSMNANGDIEVSTDQTLTEPADVIALAGAFRAGDETAFNTLAQRHRRELLIHCYRMLGSLHDAEDAVQDALLRAWKYRESLKEGAPVRPWLYRVATNVCLDAIGQDPRRSALAAKSSAESAGAPLAPAEVTWFQPIPDAFLEPTLLRDSEPESVVLTRETIEIAFLTAIQLLTPQQRAVLILRDVLDWSAKETAELLEVSVAAANSALQRARDTLRARLPPRKPEWPAGVDASAAERELLRRYVEACEKADIGAFVPLIREDAVSRMPPQPEVTLGRDAILKLFTDAGFGTAAFGDLRCVVTRANRQPAVAVYVLQSGDTTYRAMALDVLHIEEGIVSEIVTFGPEVFSTFALPLMMDATANAVRTTDLRDAVYESVR